MLGRGGGGGGHPPALSNSPSTIVPLADRPAIETADPCGCCVGTGRWLVGGLHTKGGGQGLWRWASRANTVEKEV